MFRYLFQQSQNEIFFLLYYKEKNETVQKLDNTAWNAFNYLETDTDNSAYDEFAIYEEINRKRREAELREEIIKPNKDMGRKTNNED